LYDTIEGDMFKYNKLSHDWFLQYRVSYLFV
jgi:hypothetical protein